MNKYIDAIKKAYVNKELEKLLGCNDTYVLDSSHKHYLSEDLRLTGRLQEESDPINFRAILSATEEYYCSLNTSGEKKKFSCDFRNSIEYLLASGDEKQVYFASKIYFLLGERDAKDIFYPFKGLYLSLKQNVIVNLIRCRNDLKNARIYEGKRENSGLWGAIITLNDNAIKEVKLEKIKEGV
ncbi:hypothetical protein [Butyrivibrio hungatei]|uniref:Uncharacterized protein n=1 Tax=Butyrivibrio hungatei TaxID=185008 RepID=A0A1D9P5R9_9FIRM|nr:hypothetical protein [Butyrivibrio hungatei]AOZ97881.1 hypothetical protein bhn_II082 [Butyrivibrio hungatei]